MGVGVGVGVGVDGGGGGGGDIADIRDIATIGGEEDSTTEYEIPTPDSLVSYLCLKKKELFTAILLKVVDKKSDGLELITQLNLSKSLE